MSTLYKYYISDTTNSAAKIALLTARINQDPEMPSPATSIVLNVSILEVTFPSSLSDYSSYILMQMVGAIFNGVYAGKDYVYKNNWDGARALKSTTTVPSTTFDQDSGFNTGSTIYNPTGNNLSVCLDSQVGNAKWITLSQNVAPIVRPIFCATYNKDSAQSYLVYGAGTSVAEQFGIIAFPGNLVSSLTRFSVVLQSNAGAPYCTVFLINPASNGGTTPPGLITRIDAGSVGTPIPTGSATIYSTTTFFPVNVPSSLATVEAYIQDLSGGGTSIRLYSMLLE